jgi:hypothetical protein
LLLKKWITQIGIAYGRNDAIREIVDDNQQHTVGRLIG